MTSSTITRAREVIAWIGVGLGLVAIALTLYFNTQQNDHTAAVLSQLKSGQCERSYKQADQWDSVIRYLKENFPQSVSTDPFQRFVKETHDLYHGDINPSCK